MKWRHAAGALGAIAAIGFLFALAFRTQRMRSGDADPWDTILNDFFSHHFSWAIPALIALLIVGIAVDLRRCLQQARVLPFALLRIFTAAIAAGFLALAWLIAL